MEFIKEFKKLMHNISKLMETILFAQLQSSLKRLTAKTQVKQFFGKMIPELFVSPVIMCTVFTMLFFITHHYIIGMFPFILELSLFIWWNSRKWKMQQKMFAEAKERYKRMEQLFEESPLDNRLFHMAYPDWTYALLDGFSIQALAFYAKQMGEYEARQKSRSEGYHQEYAKKFATSSDIAKAMQIFGISTCVGMTQDKLKKIYRKLAKQWHPDTHPNDEHCKEKFQQLNTAYDTLLRCV